MATFVARRPGRHRGALWAAGATAVVVASAARAGLEPGAVVNPRGWPQVARFFGAMLSPRADREFLGLVVAEAGVTVAYALLGTALALAIGSVGGVLLTERLWRPVAGRSPLGRATWAVLRFAFAVPRSIHEVVFGLLLINVLGLDPMVAILAIGIPGGAVTAKVFAELLDEVPLDAELALRASGAPALAAVIVAAVPGALNDLLSYAFYRLECSLRSAAVLGIVGAGGLGFQLALSFISLRYDEMWTFLWALVAISGVADAWSSAIRRRRNSAAVEMHLTTEGSAPGTDPRRRDPFIRGSAIVCALAVPVAAWWLALDPTTLWSDRSQRLAAELVADALPPDPGPGGWLDLAVDTVDTVALAVLAIAGAVLLAAVPSLVAARPRPVPAVGPTPGSIVRAGVGIATRAVLLVARSIPAPVGAFIAVFVFFPGLWPGAVALAISNAGTLGRLQAEVVENLDPTPAASLRASGGGRLGTLLFATLPRSIPKFTGLALYRWEVAIRETVVVGVVGAGTLGRRLDERTTAFDYDGVTATILALVVATAIVDRASAAIRAELR